MGRGIRGFGIRGFGIRDSWIRDSWIRDSSLPAGAVCSWKASVGPTRAEIRVIPIIGANLRSILHVLSFFITKNFTQLKNFTKLR